MPGVAETFKTVIDEMIYATDFKWVNLWHMEIAKLTHVDVNTSNDKLENRLNIRLVLSETLASRAQPSSNGQLPSCAWSFGIFDESHRYKTKNCVGWNFGITRSIRLTLQVTATAGVHSLNECSYQMMWLLSGVSDDS